MKELKRLMGKEAGKGMVEMKTLKILFVIMLTLTLAISTAYAAPGGNGNGRGPHKDKTKKEKIHKDNGKRSRAVERARKDADVRANLPNGANEQGRGRKEERPIKEAKLHGHDVLKALENSRWFQNPNDERGQGNMGKPDMRDPFGHDKDSGRVGSERGRPIREDVLDLAALLGIQFSLTDPYFLYLKAMLESYLYYAQRYPQYSWYTSMASYYQRAVDNFDSSVYSYYKLAVNRTDAIDYTLTFSPQEGYEATTLLITTTLTSVTDYNQAYYSYIFNPETRRYEWTPTFIQYDAGQVILENTQEVTLGGDNTLSYTYDPPTDVASYSGLYAELAVTVTEPISGASYTMTADRQLYLYRCPYGKVTNEETNESIVGAKITVHFEDGSMVPLDKASNPTASNPQITDATGRYGFKLETNRKYYITAKAPGYEEYKSEVFTEKWHVLREDIAMTPLKTVALNAE